MMPNQTQEKTWWKVFKVFVFFTLPHSEFLRDYQGFKKYSITSKLVKFMHSYSNFNGISSSTSIISKICQKNTMIALENHQVTSKLLYFFKYYTKTQFYFKFHVFLTNSFSSIPFEYSTKIKFISEIVRDRSWLFAASAILKSLAIQLLVVIISSNLYPYSFFDVTL